MEEKRQAGKKRKRIIVYAMVFIWAALVVLHMAFNVVENFRTEGPGNFSTPVPQPDESNEQPEEDLSVPSGEWDAEK